MSSNFDKTHNQFCKVYVANKKKTDTFYWGYFTKHMVNKDFKELVKSDEWDVIVVDDIRPSMPGRTKWKWHIEVDIENKYDVVRNCLTKRFSKVYSLKNFEDSWNEIADKLKLDREPRLNTNRSNEDYKKTVSKKDLDKEFLNWHNEHNRYDYLLYQEFCA